MICHFFRNTKATFDNRNLLFSDGILDGTCALHCVLSLNILEDKMFFLFQLPNFNILSYTITSIVPNSMSKLSFSVFGAQFCF